jgi:hypothetical protein
MYHALVGKRFVEAFNRTRGTKHSSKSFFDEVFFPLFFCGDKYLLYVNNSPTTQGATKNLPTQELLGKIHEKVDQGNRDASMFIGAAASDPTQTTSGQVTGIAFDISGEEVYASWIGFGLGVTIEGGLSMLFDSDEVNLAIFDGWTRYRKYLDETPELKGNQINTWNGQWLTFRFGKSWHPDYLYKPVTDGKQLITQSWTALLFSLAGQFPLNSFGVYVYAFGQMNRTVGFIRLELPKVKSLSDIYYTNFQTPAGLSPTSFEDLYETERSFVAACQQTFIGIKALKPKDIFRVERGELPKLAGTDPHKTLSADTYKTWIIAMLNNKDLLQRAQELAEVLHAFVTAEGRGKTIHTGLVEERLLKASRRQAVIDALTAILEKDGTQADLFRKTVADLLVMPTENVPLFLSLVRFEYAAIKAVIKENK